MRRLRKVGIIVGMAVAIFIAIGWIPPTIYMNVTQEPGLLPSLYWLGVWALAWLILTAIVIIGVFALLIGLIVLIRVTIWREQL